MLQALGNLGLPVHSIDSKKRDGKLAVSVTLTASAAQSPNVTKRLKTLLDALALPGAPALSLERWDFESPPTPTLVAPPPAPVAAPAVAPVAAPAPKRGRPNLTVVSNPPPAPPPAPVATASLPGEEPVDPAKDKLLLDGIKGALADLLGPQSPAPMGSP
ncbi:MAG: hypothetical protein IPN01_24410 [Deltaproteobacteria bacterium]|nr:hypothetical protein [Deltaproteobacteria bacterium]